MFKTYHDKLVEIETLYNSKDYDATIIEGAKLTEKALSIFFNQFHAFLTKKEDWNKYLQFEKAQGDKYAAFLRKPTIGVAIGYYNQLLELFHDHVGLNQDIRRHLNTINTVRNKHLHANADKATDEEAASVLDSLEKILQSTSLLKVSIDVIGVPIKYYLVFKSIREKFELAAGEDDFRKIVMDSVKIMPELLNNFLNKIYRELPMEAKEQLTDRYNATSERKKEDSLVYYLQLSLSIGIEDRLEGGMALKDSLESILADKRDQFNRRQTRHYVSALEIITHHSDNPETRHFLEFSDAVKKRYLVKHSLNERDRIVLEEKAAELSISRDLAERIEESVIKTIEKELILFQTLTIDEPVAVRSTVQGKPIKLFASKKYLIAGAVGLFLLVSAIAWRVAHKSSNFKDYEEAYFRNDFERALTLAKSHRDINNISAHWVYLSSLNNFNSRIPKEIKAEYQDLYKHNPESGPANLYLGLVYFLDWSWRAEHDSSWILIQRAEKLGVKGVELALIKEYHILQWEPTEYKLENMALMEEMADPRTAAHAASDYLYQRHDTVRFHKLIKDALRIFPDYQSAYLDMARYSARLKQFDSADYYLEKAEAINPNTETYLWVKAEITKLTGKYDVMKKVYRDGIKGFAKNTLEVYHDLAWLLMEEDSIKQGIRFVDSALLKFPRDRGLLDTRREMEEREAVLKKIKNTKTTFTIPWEEDLDKALAYAKAEGKNVFLYTYRPGDFWTLKLDRDMFTDSVVIQRIRAFVPVKVNMEMHFQELRRRFKIGGPSALLILNPEGRVISQPDRYANKEELLTGIQKSIDDARVVEEARDPSKRFTVVNNFEDARIIARSKNMPIMILVGDDQSAPTKRMLEESFQHPLFKPATQNMVYLYLNKDSTEPVMTMLQVQTFPSIFFLTPDGKVFDQVMGYQPGQDLATRLKAVKTAHSKKNYSMPARINWLYSMQEAKALSVVLRKNIYVYLYFDNNCNSCNLMDETTFRSSDVISRLNNEFICLKLNVNSEEGSRQYEQLAMWDLPGNCILDPNDVRLFLKGGYLPSAQMVEWLKIDEPLRLLVSLGYDEYKTFMKENSLAKTLIRTERYQSALEILLKEREQVPGYRDVLLDIGNCYLSLNKGEEALKYHEEAINKGAVISDMLVRGLVDDFVISKRLDKAAGWFDHQISINKNKENAALLTYGKSIALEYLADQPAAVAAAKKSIQVNPEGRAGYYQVIKLSLWNNQLAEAEAYLRAGQRAFPGDGLLLFYDGRLAEKKGQVRESKAFYTNAAAASGQIPNMVSPTHMFNTTNAYTYPGVMNFLEKAGLDATKADPGAFMSYHILAHKYLLDGNLEQAMVNINKSIDHSADPDNKMVKGLVLYKEHKMEEGAKVITESEDVFLERNYGPYDFVAIALRDLYLNRKEDARKQLVKASTWREPVGIDGYYKKLAGEMLADLK